MNFDGRLKLKPTREELEPKEGGLMSPMVTSSHYQHTRDETKGIKTVNQLVCHCIFVIRWSTLKQILLIYYLLWHVVLKGGRCHVIMLQCTYIMI